MKTEILLHRIIRNMLLLILCVSAVLTNSYATPHTLTIIKSGSGSGSVSLSPSGGSYDPGTEVIMTVTPDPGSQFLYWQGAVSGTENPKSITIMNLDITVMATIGYIQYQLTTNVSDSVSGSVSLLPSGGSYDNSKKVFVSAAPAEGYHFDHWGGDLSGTNACTNITMNSNKDVTAYFSPGSPPSPPMPPNWRYWMGPVKNQIPKENCIAMATTGVVEGQLHISIDSNISISLEENEIGENLAIEEALIYMGNFKIGSKVAGESGIFPNLKGVRWGISGISSPAKNLQAKKNLLSNGPITTTIINPDPYYPPHEVAIVSYDDTRGISGEWFYKDSQGIQAGDSGYQWLGYEINKISTSWSYSVTVDPSCYAKIVPELIPSLSTALGYGFVPDEWIYYTGSQILSGPSVVNFSTNNSFVVTGTLLIPNTITINNPPTYESNSYILTLDSATAPSAYTYKFNNLDLGAAWKGTVATNQHNLLQVVGGGNFLRWSDGVTQNPRTIPLSNSNITLTAVFGVILSGHVYKYGCPYYPLDSVLFSGLPHPPQSTPSGEYGDQVPYRWSGTVTPTRVGYTFSPASRTYTNVTLNQLNEDYAATPTNYTISGYVKVNGTNSLSGVAMNGLPGNPATNPSGYYTAMVGHGWSDTVRPKKASYVFAPGWQSYKNVTSNKSQNYIAIFIGGKIIAEPEDNSHVLVCPQEFALLQNVPNPFNPTTVINYQLPVASNVSLKVFDMLGKEVATLVDGTKEAGYYTATFNGSRLASGIYFTRFVVNPQDGNKTFVQVKKMLMTK